MTRILPLLTWRAAICDSGLPPTVRHVALTLSLYMNERGGSAHPGPARLAHDTGLHAKTVAAALRELDASGWLRLVRQGGALPGQKRRANVYEARTPPRPTAQDSRSDGAHLPPRTPGQSAHLPSTLPRPTAQDSPISSENSPIKKPLAPAARNGSAARKRDLLWEAVLAACRVSDPIPRGARGAYNRAVGDLREIGATAEEVHRRAGVFRRTWPGVSLTPTALARRWSEVAALEARPSDTGSRVGAIVSAVYRELDQEDP